MGYWIKYAIAEVVRMSHWIFQNAPDLWDLRNEFVEGREVAQKVSRYADQMEVGGITLTPRTDRVVYMMAK